MLRYINGVVRLNTTFDFSGYFALIDRGNCAIDQQDLVNACQMIQATKDRGGKVILVGNGGSASIVSHVSVDLTKAANIPAMTYSDTSLLTCFSNDYGYEHWLEKAVEFYASKDDLLIAVSSSGASENIINCVIKAKSMSIPTITFSGFSEDNRLRQLGDMNFWVGSDKYNIVETVHQVWLLAMVDCLVHESQSVSV